MDGRSWMDVKPFTNTYDPPCVQRASLKDKCLKDEQIYQEQEAPHYRQLQAPHDHQQSESLSLLDESKCVGESTESAKQRYREEEWEGAVVIEAEEAAMIEQQEAEEREEAAMIKQRYREEEWEEVVAERREEAAMIKQQEAEEREEAAMIKLQEAEEREKAAVIKQQEAEEREEAAVIKLQEAEEREEAAIKMQMELERALNKVEEESRAYKEEAEQAERKLKDKDGWSALMVASKRGNCQDVKSLLEGGGSQVNYQDKDGWSALMVACRWGERGVTRLLLDHHADKYTQSTEWKWPMSLALLHEHSDIVALLEERDAVPESVAPSPAIQSVAFSCGRSILYEG